MKNGRYCNEQNAQIYFFKFNFSSDDWIWYAVLNLLYAYRACLIVMPRRQHSGTYLLLIVETIRYLIDLKIQEQPFSHYWCIIYWHIITLKLNTTSTTPSCGGPLRAQKFRKVCFYDKKYDFWLVRVPFALFKIPPKLIKKEGPFKRGP